MATSRRDIILIFLCIWLLSNPFCIGSLGAKDFVVVIDPGHGGRDPGAVGKISKEKDINLKVAQKVGNLIKKNCRDVKLIYTRSKDVFVALDKRAEIANDAKADLFISIHTNSIAGSKTVKGASTWTLGLARSKANLEVAKRENSVILYESDYQTRYAGFDPNSSESYIIFEFMQDKYMEQSVHLASLMQQNFKNTCKRTDRGVHQAEFLVLRATAMPSVLVELGFISTPEEERYLNTDEGTTNLAKGIYQAFLQYKKEHDDRLGIAESPTPGNKNIQEKENQVISTDTAPANSTDNITFMVQIATSSKLLNLNDKMFKGLKNIDYYKENNLYKYTYGASENYNKVVQTRKEILDKFPDAFIIAFRKEEKLNINKAIEEFKNTKRK